MASKAPHRQERIGAEREALEVKGKHRIGRKASERTGEECIAAARTAAERAGADRQSSDCIGGPSTAMAGAHGSASVRTG